MYGIAKLAFIGVGVPVTHFGNEDRWNVSLGFPYGVGVSREFGDTRIRPSLGVGLLPIPHPHLGLVAGKRNQPTPEEVIEKEASLAGLAAGFAVAEGTAQGLRLFGKNRGANFFEAGKELGAKGERMHPFTENVSKNLFGQRQLFPYEAGLEVGKRMQPMDADKQERFLERVVGMANARKGRLEAETGGKVKDPILQALGDYQAGVHQKNPLFGSVITKGSRPEGTNSLAGQIAANVSTLPTAVIDSRFAIRPAIRAVEKQPAVAETQAKLFPVGTTRQKVYDVVRNYID